MAASKLRIFYGRLMSHLGLSYLSRDFLQFVKMHQFYNIATNLSGVFISTFLLRAGSGFEVIAIFYLTAYSVECMGNVSMPFLTSKFSQAALSRAGMVLYLGSYLLLLGFQEKILAFFPIIAAMSAIGASLYWVPYHYYCINYTMPHNRQFAMSFQGMISNVVVLITPLLSGIITSGMKGIYGYIVIFTISAVSFVIAIIISRKLPSAPAKRPKHAFWVYLKEQYRKTTVNALSLTHFFYGLRDGVYMYFINILIFEMISSELILGLSITGRSILVIITFILIGKFLTRQRRSSLNFATLGFALALSCALLALRTAWVLIALSVLDAVTQAIIHNSMQLCAYETADILSKNGVSLRDETIAMRNSSLNFGRLFGVIFFIIVSSMSSTVEVWPLVALNAMALPAAFLMRIIMRHNASA